MTSILTAVGTDPRARLARLPRALDATRYGRTIAHLLEMLAAMYVGMAFVGLQVDGFAAAVGFADLATRHRAAATVLMALEMTLPMVLWMDYRGHSRRSIAEMAAAMIVPALVLIAVLPGDPMAVYHPAMLIAMVSLVAARAGDHGRH